MQNNDPYQPPSSNVATAASMETYQPKVFTTEGRIGRLRFLVYSLLGHVFLFSVLTVVTIASTTSTFRSGVPAILTSSLFTLSLLAMIALSIILAKRRFNDMEFSGWMATLLFIPIVNVFIALWLVLSIGTIGSNRFGAMPNENPLVVKILGLAAPILILTGLLTVVLLPALTTWL